MSSRVEIEVTAEDLNATSTLASVDNALKKQGDTLDKTSEQAKKSTAETGQLTQELGKFTDTTFLATEGINNLRGGLLGAGFGIITGVAIAAATAFFEWALNTKDLNEQLKLASDNFLNLTKTINGALAASNEFREAEDKLLRSEQAIERAISIRALATAEASLVNLESLGTVDLLKAAYIAWFEVLTSPIEGDVFNVGKRVEEGMQQVGLEADALRARIELLKLGLQATNPEFIKTAEIIDQWQGPLRATTEELEAIEAQTSATAQAFSGQMFNVLDTIERLQGVLSEKELNGLNQTLAGFNIQLNAQREFLESQGIVSQEAKDAEIQRVTDFNALLQETEREAEQARLERQEEIGQRILDQAQLDFSVREAAAAEEIALTNRTAEAVVRAEALKTRAQQAGLSIAMTLAGVASAFATKQSKVVFLITRGLMAAQAFVATQAAATMALAVPIAPNYALEEITRATGMANVAAIIATSFSPGGGLVSGGGGGGGGGSIPSVGGGGLSGGAANAFGQGQNQQQPGIKVEIHVNTLDPASLENFDWEPVMAPLADALGNHVSRGGSTGEVDLVINARGD